MNFDLNTTIDIWRRVLTQPGEEVFEQEKLDANGTLTLGVIWMVIAGVIAAIFGVIQAVLGIGAMTTALSQAGLPPEMEQMLSPMMGSMLGGATFVSIITVPVFFLIGALIYHLLATVLGGSGDFGKFAYLFATFQAPLTMGAALLGVIPVLGGCLALLLSVYSYVLSYFAIKVNYGLTQGRALAVILIPLGVLLLLGVCALIVVLAGLASLAAN